MQFEYGLLQERSRKLENRPASFATTTGKVIHVDHKAAKTMDNIAKRGSVCVSSRDSFEIALNKIL